MPPRRWARAHVPSPWPIPAPSMPPTLPCPPPPPAAAAYRADLALTAKSIREFDNAITRISFGWPDGERWALGLGSAVHSSRLVGGAARCRRPSMRALCGPRPAPEPSIPFAVPSPPPPAVDAYYAGSSSSLSIPDVRIPLLVIQVRWLAGHTLLLDGHTRALPAAAAAAGAAPACCLVSAAHPASNHKACNPYRSALPAQSQAQAADDPIAPKEAIPFEAIQANPNCLLVLTPTGGHLGWCGGVGGATGGPRAGAGVRPGAGQTRRCRRRAAAPDPTGLRVRLPTTAGAPWTDAGVAEYFTAAQQLLAQPAFAAGAAAARARQPAPAEPAGVYTQGATTHQAP